MSYNFLDKSGLTYFWDKIKGKFLQLSGGTMTGQLKTSFKSSVAVGSYQAEATTIPALVEEVRYSSGCMGSANITTEYMGTIGTDWYNFIWIPHRSGGINGTDPGGDSVKYGNLLLCSMTTNKGVFRIRCVNGSIVETVRISDANNIYEAYLKWGGKNIAADVSPNDMGCIDEFGHNKLAFLPASCIDVAYSTDGGTTWVDYGLTDTQKVAMVTTSGPGVTTGGSATATADNVVNHKLRVRIACGTVSGSLKLYTSAKKFLLNISNNGASATVTIRRRSIANYMSDTDTWTDVGTYNIAGGSGWNSIPFIMSFGGNMQNQTSQVGQVEFVFNNLSLGTWSSKKTSLFDIRLIGSTNWACPSEIARAGHLYTMDTSQNAAFPAKVTATTFEGNLSGNATSATSATKFTTILLTSENLNSVTTPALYNAGGGNGVSNKPSSVDAFGLKVFKTAAGYITQELIEGNNNPGKRYTRQYDGGSWTSWTEMKYTDTTYSDATQSVHGLMSTTDKSKLDNFSANDLLPITSKEYTGIYGSANDRAGASFYFAYVRPTDFYNVWRIKYRVYANVPNQDNYKQYSEVEIFGNQGGMSYQTFNRLYSTNYRCYLYHNTYLLNATGYNANYKHAIGIGLRSSTNPTSSSYPRTIKIELLETENCEVTLIDTPVKEANIPGYGSTNFTGASEFNGGDNGLQESGDATNIWQLRHGSGNYTAYAKLYRNMICFSKNETSLLPANSVNNSTATTKALTTEEFNPFGQILYYNSTTTVNANSAIAASALYNQVNIDLRYSFNTGSTLTTNKDVFIKCTPQSNGMVKLDTTTPIVQVLPTTADGKVYIYLGHASATTNIEIYPEHPVYEFKDNAIRLYKGPSEAVYTNTEKTKLAGIASGATANTGTVTSVAVKMNGSTKGTITTSGTIDLGTVITTVDDELDSSVSATNPVQNWVISSAIDALDGEISETYEMIPQIIYRRLNNATISSATIDSIVNGTYGS